ncbi:MAG: ATPase [Peptococcaceae bacterium]|nr:ATPase [Peptococcaceae bacterium]
MTGRIRKMFPGGNTSEGFYSYYPYLLEKGTNRTFVIKGGPGVGKSTLMKKVGKKMVEQGYDVEFHYCSSDSNSLDGIVIEQLGIVMVDGTAPHMIDPQYPGGLDEIINLGEFWDIDSMQNNREKIINCTKNVSRSFARAYSYLKAARFIADNISAVYEMSMNYVGVNRIAGIFQDILNDTYHEGRIGKERHLFSCAYTPEGFIDLTDSILQDSVKVYYIEGWMGTGKTTLMSKIAARAIEKGLDVEIYHTPLIPRKIGTILIKDLNMALTTSKSFKNRHEEVIDLNQFLNRKIIEEHKEVLEKDNALLTELISMGISNIRQAKAEHDVLENYYIPNMNFAAADDKSEEILNRILKVAERNRSTVSGRHH